MVSRRQRLPVMVGVLAPEARIENPEIAPAGAVFRILSSLDAVYDVTDMSIGNN